MRAASKPYIVEYSIVIFQWLVTINDLFFFSFRFSHIASSLSRNKSAINNCHFANDNNNNWTVDWLWMLRYDLEKLKTRCIWWWSNHERRWQCPSYYMQCTNASHHNTIYYYRQQIIFYRNIYMKCMRAAHILGYGTIANRNQSCRLARHLVWCAFYAVYSYPTTHTYVACILWSKFLCDFRCIFVCFDFSNLAVTNNIHK